MTGTLLAPPFCVMPFRNAKQPGNVFFSRLNVTAVPLNRYKVSIAALAMHAKKKQMQQVSVNGADSRRPCCPLKLSRFQALLRFLWLISRPSHAAVFSSNEVLHRNFEHQASPPISAWREICSLRIFPFLRLLLLRIQIYGHGGQNLLRFDFLWICNYSNFRN